MWIRLVATAIGVSLASLGCGFARITGPVPEGESVRSSTEDRVCVLTPNDGRFGSNVYLGSGLTVATRTLGVLRSQYRQAMLLRTANEDEAFEACKRQRGRHLVIPIIVDWEDRASGMPARVQVELRLRELDADGRTRLVTFEAKQGLHLFRSHAEDLLTDTFDAAVLRLLPGQ